MPLGCRAARGCAAFVLGRYPKVEAGSVRATQRAAVSESGSIDRAMKCLLQPESVAILGCSSDLNRISGRPLKYFLQKGYKGRLYPVNPNQEEIAGLRCYPDVQAIPGPVDLAIVAVAAGL